MARKSMTKTRGMGSARHPLQPTPSKGQKERTGPHLL